MNSDTNAQPCQPQAYRPSSNKTSDGSAPDSALEQLPQLGNFSRILASAVVNPRIQISASEVKSNHSSLPEKCTRLGDFGRILRELQAPISPEQPSSRDALFAADIIPKKGSLTNHSKNKASTLSLLQQKKTESCLPKRHGQPNPTVKQPCFIILRRPVASQQRPTGDAASLELEPSSESDECSELDSSVLTPASTPPSPEETSTPFQTSSSSVSKKKCSSSSGKTSRSRKSESGILLSFHVGKDSAVVNVYGKVRTKEEKHNALMADLVPHRALDAVIARKFPKVASNGIHVFIDMSNIDIGFRDALGTRHKLADNAYFSPLPHLNLKFLTETLVRGRTTVTRSVGCSVVPGRPEPRFIQELQKLDYHVDLRQRKLVHDAKPATSNAVRYVEDLVDETLQTRIAESVMEYFQKQGTIILATGDAKPAQYSDGFFTYVDRALRMGWNVELVSWKGSLSSTWTSRKWKSQWGERFRVIELDDFLDNLVACNT